MREYKSVEEVAVSKRLASVTCNKCGQESTSGIYGDEDYTSECFQELTTSFHYGSRYDSERWRFDLCEDCLTELIKTFKHVPNGFGEDSYYAVYPQVMFDEWKETGEVDLEAGMTEDEIEARGGSIYANYEEEDK